jgi:adenine-specific DNA-methyltransferase
VAKRGPAAPKAAKKVEALRHPDDKRLNIPTAEHQSVLEAEHLARKTLRYPRNTDLDPQLVWRGKDYQDWSELVVQAPPLYIQEKVHPKVLIDDLLRESKGAKGQESSAQIDLFADFNGVAEGADRTDFYQHDQNWTNRLILGDSLQVMASLAEREGLRGKVQCIYIDPPYGIKFNSNFQWSTTSREVKDGTAAHITREPEQVKAFRDTWRDGIHSYLTYLRDRLTMARDLLTDSGSIFVQIGDENVHRVRAVMDEAFGDDNFVGLIFVKKTGGLGASGLKAVADYIVWYSRHKELLKFRPLFAKKEIGKGETTGERYDQLESADGSRQRPMMKEEKSDPTLVPAGWKAYQLDNLTSGAFRPNTTVDYVFEGQTFHPGVHACWKTTVTGLDRLGAARRIERAGQTLRYKRFLDDFPAVEVTNLWNDVAGAADKVYVVQTSTAVMSRCILMSSDPGDLVLDPTCGSGTAAVVAEQWGRRWITIDTSRVALALARARIMGARFPYNILADSRDGQLKEAELAGRSPSLQPVHGTIRQGFVYERVPHITLGSIANNVELDVIRAKWDALLEPLRDSLNKVLKQTWREWEIPREFDVKWDETGKKVHADWWKARSARQNEIDASIAAKAEFEFLYDRPYVDPKTVRVAGPFTVESLSPHRTLGVDENDELIDPLQVKETGAAYGQTFEQMILDNLRAAGVQQAHKADRITFTSLTPWPGEMVCAEGRFREGDAEKRAAIFIGPEFGTVSRPDLVQAAREAGDGGFDVLIACAFNYEAHASEFSKLGRVPVLKARMNADLHMGGELKATGKANLFVVFGEPDIEILHEGDGRLMVHVKGVDVFDPTTGEVRSDGADGIACWFIDTDYNEESFFVRHAYFLGQNDPYGALKTTLKAEINADVWASLNSEVSRPFPTPTSGRIAVKVINHLGDEVMKVFRVE